jgi:hypothetical protein
MSLSICDRCPNSLMCHDLGKCVSALTDLIESKCMLAALERFCEVRQRQFIDGAVEAASQGLNSHD